MGLSAAVALDSCRLGATAAGLALRLLLVDADPEPLAVVAPFGCARFRVLLPEPSATTTGAKYARFAGSAGATSSSPASTSRAGRFPRALALRRRGGGGDGAAASSSSSLGWSRSASNASERRGAIVGAAQRDGAEASSARRTNSALHNTAVDSRTRVKRAGTPSTGVHRARGVGRVQSRHALGREREEAFRGAQRRVAKSKLGIRALGPQRAAMGA